MPRNHTWEDIRKYVFFHWVQNCLKRALLSITINDSYIMYQEVDTPLARIVQSNKSANIVNIILKLPFQWLPISK